MTRAGVLAVAVVAAAVAASAVASLGCETSGRALTDVKLTPLPSCDERGVNYRSQRRLDLLFVIDDSVSMASKQAALARTFEALVARLEALPYGLPSLHVGVVTSDLGAGGFDVPACDTSNNGFLLPFDLPGQPAWLEQEGDAHNFPGTLAAAFATLRPVDHNGCGYEQPLAAMVRAIAPGLSSNPGFLRDDAVFAVVFVTDEDDCSIYPGSHLYDPLDTRWGPTSVRCFNEGVRCTGSPGGALQACHANAESNQVVPIDVYEDFLLTLKGRDRSRLVVGAIVGNPDPVVVGINAAGVEELLPSCRYSTGTALPAVRLAELVARFGTVGNRQSICNDDMTGVLASLGDTIAASVRGCFSSP